VRPLLIRDFLVNPIYNSMACKNLPKFNLPHGLPL
jgi:hypothetical protein